MRTADLTVWIRLQHSGQDREPPAKVPQEQPLLGRLHARLGRGEWRQLVLSSGGHLRNKVEPAEPGAALPPLATPNFVT
ncbi:hypothetical protein AVEN_89528-1 [Araneus ventricosus]|uniref:Uncharacterized protein n=1 Tax=Araneus ventricosus TaxID=182803 RepID=A0A4Y2KKI3_ARAVE|nr:hypothetical protein AVEN_89528-1 [Araneus ventricosus]